MNTSPKKHPATFRPIDTIASSQRLKPRTPANSSTNRRIHRLTLEADENSYLPEGYSEQSSILSLGGRSEIDFLGNSSSLFDEDYNQPLHSTPPLAVDSSRKNTQRRNIVTKPNNMVREREPPAPQPRTEQPVLKPLQELVNTAPEFGKTSPIRNPLRKEQQKDASSCSQRLIRSGVHFSRSLFVRLK